MKQYNLSLFIFRRDLRIQDNTGLIVACSQSKQVIPCFIFDPRQISKKNNFASTNAIQFMIQSLQDLQSQLKQKSGKLYLFYGNTDEVIAKLIKNLPIDAVFCNRDYTPFSLKRDGKIKQICIKNKTEFIPCNDLLLNQPEDIATGSGTPYSVFTAFYKKASLIPVQKPTQLRATNFYTKSIPGSEKTTIYKKVSPQKNPDIWINGGTKEADKVIRTLSKHKEYIKTRDFPEYNTTHLSAHLKFGTISIRHTFYAIAKKLGKAHPLLRQLYWRDFFTHVAYHSPFVLGQPYHAKYKKLQWSKNTKHFTAWKQGKTGFPIVDAGMRQLNTTGFMHNRVRMIVGSFLTKDLHIDWQKGEKYFAQQLVDYDPSVNNGNWQWVASTGCDAQPYFRIFNPWLQQKKFDPDCTYIKTWVPELKNIAPKIIHNLFKEKHEPITGYPRPIVDHSIEQKKAKLYYKKAK